MTDHKKVKFGIKVGGVEKWVDANFNWFDLEDFKNDNGDFYLNVDPTTELLSILSEHIKHQVMRMHDYGRLYKLLEEINDEVRG